VKFLNDGKFAIGLFSGIIVCIALALASDTFALGPSALTGALGVLIGGAISALPSFYTQWLSYSQIEGERVRQYNERRSALASNLHAKLLRSMGHAGHISNLFEQSKLKAEASKDKQPSLLFAGVALRPPELTISDDELCLALEALKGKGKLDFLVLQDEFNQLCEMSNVYTVRRQEAFRQYLTLDAVGQTRISFPQDRAQHIDALVHELDILFDSLLKRSKEVVDRISKTIVDITEGFLAMPEIQSKLLRMELKNGRTDF
jgi:hypothetical protein